MHSDRPHHRSTGQCCKIRRLASPLDRPRRAWAEGKGNASDSSGGLLPAETSGIPAARANPNYTF